MIRLFVACLFVFCFSSCFDCHEEVWLNPDASGSARVQIAMPLSVAKLHGGREGLEQMIQEYFEVSPAYTSHAVETSIAGERLHIDLAVTFSNALELIEATSPAALEKLPSAAGDLLGQAKVDFQGLNMDFSRRFDLSKSLPGARYFSSDRLQGHSLTTIIHLPNPASKHNATATSNDGRTLIWNTPLQLAVLEPVNHTFTMKIPIPWATLIVSVIVLILLIAILGYFLMRRFRAAKTLL